MRSNRSSPHSRLRFLTERCTLVVIALFVMRTWYVEGLLVPLRITGGSMATTLLGSHYQVHCDRCEHRFACEADPARLVTKAVCPLCGYAGNDLQGKPVLAGDGIVVDKSIFRLRQPRRWEVVVFRRPEPPYRTYVKRVVGLPEESIRIRDGDVYIKGQARQMKWQIQRKTLPQQRSMAILVHDAASQPPGLPPRWQGEGWLADRGRFARGSDPAAGDQRRRAADDWLEYCHWRRVPGSDPPSENEVRAQPCPITDLCGYNQTRPRREEDVHPVTDVMLSLRLVVTRGEGNLAIRASDGRDEFTVLLYPNRQRYEVLRGDDVLPGAVGKSPLLTDGVEIVLSLFDKQLLLAFDGRPVVTREYDPSPVALKPTARPLAIGSQGGLGVTISDVRVYRDVYYMRPVGARHAWGVDSPCALAADEYFVLGDNSPISEDSRNWPSPAVPAKLLVGKALVVHFPARRVSVGPLKFQVPDPARIRYIR